MTTAEAELFDTTKYQVPFQQADGHDVTDLVLRLAGTLKLNRNDPDHVALIDSLTLGRNVELRVFASVEGKAQSVRFQGDDEIVTYTVGVRLHSAEAV